jgi:hypothetical protein
MSQASGKALLVVMRAMLLDECDLYDTQEVKTASQKEEELAILTTMDYCGVPPFPRFSGTWSRTRPHQLTIVDGVIFLEAAPTSALGGGSPRSARA